ncbi:hypothetical protein QTJ16_004763 [Diplocarpon rosae]|uniref:Enoyl-CoA hydratase n=1 Tax=Diplocarpon rosae TaxID=946125 RepID=A0AAD9SXN7_9HELO|nr:hypothetical protein QTJ16_004763 [Diplocarpon rosae]
MASSLPESYSDLSFPHVKLFHVPPSCPTLTPVILVTRHRPQNQNAFTDLMTDSLCTSFALLSSDPRVKSIVVTGHGRMFCAGADLDTGLSYKDDTARTHRDGGGKVALAILRCCKPVVAAVNGSAVGVGITMTLPMDIRLVSERAKIGFVFARRGIVMEAASSFFLPRLVGYSRAMHLATTGEVLRADHSLLDGLFSEILPEDQVLGRALAIADDIARNTSAVSTKLMRDLIWSGLGSAEQTHLLDSKILPQLFDGEDKMEGVKSFLENRAPRFQGTMPQDAPDIWPWWQPAEVKVERGARAAAKPKL